MIDHGSRSTWGPGPSVKLGPHTKFGEDWSNGLAVHWIHTYIQTDNLTNIY